MKPLGKYPCAFLWAILAGTLLLSAFRVPLSGQTFEQRVDAVVSRARIRVGPFRIHPVLEFSQFGWVSNIYGQAASERMVSDFVITPSPKLNVYFILRRRLILSFTENPEYHFYLKSHQYNHFANNYWADLTFPFFGSLIISTGLFSRSQRSLALAELDRQVETVAQGVRAEVAYETGRRISFSLTGSFSKLEYKDILLVEGSSDLLARNLNREESSGLAEVRYQAFSASTLFFRGGYTQYAFPQEEAGWRNSQSVHFLCGFRLPSPSRLSGSLAAGLRRFLNLGNNVKAYSGFIADTRLSYRLGAATSLSVGYNHELMFSYMSDVLFYINDSLYSGLTINIGRSLSVQVNGNYARLRHSGLRENETGEIGPLVGRMDRRLNLSAGFSIPLFRGLRAGLSYHYWTRLEGFSDKRDGHLVTFDLIR